VSSPREVRFAPIASDVDAAIRLSSDAVRQYCRRVVPAQDPAPRVSFLSEQLRAGTAPGRLYLGDGRPTGVVLWDDESSAAPGLHLHLAHLDDVAASAEEYDRLLAQLSADVAPIMFLPATLNGLEESVEARLLSARGFARFGRSEMRYPPDAPPPAPGVTPGVSLRPLRDGDEPRVATVHTAAFGQHFDFYLYQRDREPRRNSELEVHDMMHGRWGELIPEVSFLAEGPGDAPCGMALFVRMHYGPLLISLAVDPKVQGRGVGRALTAAGVRALRERGETVIALNVTEGNRRAVALYESLGFVRSLGPEWAWYSTHLVPIAPDGSPSRPEPPPPAPHRSGR
jgi:ribosomal protein S18 acetylase RimI-like enzyme